MKKPPSRKVDGEVVCGQAWGDPPVVCTLRVGHLGWEDGMCFSAGTTYLDEKKARQTIRRRQIASALRSATKAQLLKELKTRK